MQAKSWAPLSSLSAEFVVISCYSLAMLARSRAPHQEPRGGFGPPFHIRSRNHESEVAASSAPFYERFASTCYSTYAAEPWNAGTKKPFPVCVLTDGDCSNGEQTMAFVIFGVAIGALCAVLRYPVLMMLPMGGLLAIGAVLNGIIVHAHPGVIATEVFDAWLHRSLRTHQSVSRAILFARKR